MLSKNNCKVDGLTSLHKMLGQHFLTDSLTTDKQVYVR